MAHKSKVPSITEPGAVATALNYETNGVRSQISAQS
jgi:hypothetical protein